MAIPVPVAELVGTFVEVMLYGGYILIFPQCLNTLRKRPLSTALMLYLSGTMVVSLLLITTHLVVDITRSFMAFTSNMSTPDFPETFFANVDTKLNICKNASLVSATLLADTLLLYRTFIVWGRNYWICIFPALLWLVDAAMSAWFTWAVNQAKPGTTVLKSTVFAVSKYFCSATLAMNLVCTALIAFRVWYIQRRVVNGHQSGETRSRSIVSILLESAAIYTAFLICLIGTASKNSSSMFFFLNSMPPVEGCVFSYVIIRSSMDNKRFTSHKSSVLSTRVQENSLTLSRMGYGFGSRGTIKGLEHDQERTGVDIMVHLEQTVHHDHDLELDRYAGCHTNSPSF